MKRISVYARKDGWYFHAMSKTTAGVWIATPPYLKECLSIDAGKLGELVLKALQSSQQNVPHPTEWDHVFDPMLDLAGVKTWGRFMVGAASIDVAQDGEYFDFEANRNEGPRTGYTAVKSPPVQIPLKSTPKEVGEAVKQAFALCE